MEKGNELKNRLVSAGWELIESRSVLCLWVAEIWKIKSVLSPTECVVYLTFVIDSQSDSKDPTKVNQVIGSLIRPDDWFVDGDFEDIAQFGDVSAKSTTVFLGRRQEKYLDEFIKELANLRHAFEGVAK